METPSSIKYLDRTLKQNWLQYKIKSAGALMAPLDEISKLKPVVIDYLKNAAKKVVYRNLKNLYNDAMKNSEYPLEQQAYAARGPSTFGVVLTSVITSTIITLGTLFVTGNLSINDTSKEKEATASPMTHAVPSLIGIPVKSAKELLKVNDLRLVVTSEQPDNSMAKGNIIEQRPLPESDLEAGGKVEVVVSSGAVKTTVPNIVGKSLSEAEVLLKNAGIVIGQKSFDGEGAPGIISKVTPAPGTQVEEGTQLAVVAAPLDVAVPDVLGKRTSQAKATIKKAGLKIGKIRWRYNENRPANLVLAQEPEPGTRVPPNSEIDLTLNPE